MLVDEKVALLVYG
jgi:hypothetical protein